MAPDPREAAAVAARNRAGMSGRRVYGLAAGKPAIAELPKAGRVPAGWTWICVEGDAEWTRLPERAKRESAT